MEYILSDQVLGRGGMGVVMRGRHPSLEREVAIKLLSNEFAGDAEFVERFMREARLSARVRHPNVVSVFDAGCGDDGRPYLVMELLDGESLRDRMRRAPLTEQQAQWVAIEVLRALSAAHREGVTHRDVKPANVFVTRKNEVKLMDFGIATALSESRLTSTGGFVGTAEYMAPEQVQGKNVDGRADLYAVGVMLMEMLSGKVPFTGDTLSVLHRHVHEAPPTLPNADARINAILQRLLAKSPDQRFPSAEEAIRALESKAVVSVPKARRASTGTKPTLMVAGFAGIAIAVVAFAAIPKPAASTAPTMVTTITAPAPPPTIKISARERLLKIETGLQRADVAAGKAVEAERAIRNATAAEKAKARQTWQGQLHDSLRECFQAVDEAIEEATTARREGVPVASATLAALEVDRAVALLWSERDPKPALDSADRYLAERGNETQTGLTVEAKESRLRTIRSTMQTLRKMREEIYN